MRRAKSRNFILVVCGVLLLLLGSFGFTRVLMKMMVEVSEDEKREELLSNVVSTSSKVKLSGGGNFIESTPVVKGISITRFNVKLSNPSDKVSYSIKFCNMNDEDLVYKNLWEGEITCSDLLGAKKSCVGIKIDGYVLKGERKLKVNEKIQANSCIELVVDASFESFVPSETVVSIDEYSLELDMK